MCLNQKYLPPRRRFSRELWSYGIDQPRDTSRNSSKIKAKIRVSKCLSGAMNRGFLRLWTVVICAQVAPLIGAALGEDRMQGYIPGIRRHRCNFLQFVSDADSPRNIFSAPR